jgi:type IV secretory pathway VirB2 component (pilin)
MGSRVGVAFFVVVMVVLIVGVDVLFLRHQFWPRLLVNVGIVAVFAAAYFLFLKRR